MGGKPERSTSDLADSLADDADGEATGSRPPVGKRWPAHDYEVGREKVREYAAAVGERSPLCHDPEAARAAGLSGVVAPPLFAAVFSAPALAAIIFDPEVGVFDPRKGLAGYRFLQRSQTFRWGAPVCAGDVITTAASLTGAEVRDGQKVRLFETTSTNQRGEVVVSGAYEGVVPNPSRRRPGARPRRNPELELGPDHSGLLRLGEVGPGDALPGLIETPDRYAGVRYAGASGDFTPFHLDDQFARSAGLDGMILHGLYTLAFLVRALCIPFGSDPRLMRELSARFRRVARPELELQARARVERSGEEGIELRSEVVQDSEIVLDSSRARLALP